MTAVLDAPPKTKADNFQAQRAAIRALRASLSEDFDAALLDRDIQWAAKLQDIVRAIDEAGPW